MSDLAVPLLDLKPQYEEIAEEVTAAIDRVARSQQFILGPEVEAFEAELASYCGARHALGVSSGTDALLLALMALGVGPEDEVITPTYSFFATAGSIARTGATPVFVDVDPETFNVLPAAIEAAVTSRTKAIIPVHLFGQTAEMTAIQEIATRYGLAVIEDAAQAIGAEHRGRRAGSMGTAGCFSFFPSKNLGAFGDAGAITTNDSALAERMRILRVHGSHPKYYHKFIGGNFRLDAIQAAVLRVKLAYLDRWTEGRQRNASFYAQSLGRHGLTAGTVGLPKITQDRHTYNQFVIRVEDRDELQQSLKNQQIGTEIYYPVPLHVQECFRYLGYRPTDLPNAERLAATSLALPIFAELTTPQLQRVVDGIGTHYSSSRIGRMMRRAA